MRLLFAAIGVAASSALFVGACKSESSAPPPPTLDTAGLQDPQSCVQCHADHVNEWSGSMHAYASEDPVFLAMNARGQRETNGALGTFCVKCHAPMAVATGATKDGLNLASLPAPMKGVTCYFCHSVDAVNGANDNPLSLATDGALRAGISDPVHNTAHDAAYEPLLDRSQLSSASLCGSCHDIETMHGAHIERTFSEWQDTLFSHGAGQLTCGQCHMQGTQGLAAQAPGVPLREVHDHGFPGVDLALGTFPNAAAQRTRVQALLDTTLQSILCVRAANLPGATTIQVVLDNVAAGHDWPSGSTQDRRAWVEVIAYLAGKVIYQSGAVADDASVVASTDPDLWLIRDCMIDGQGKQANMFWDAASVDSNQLPGPTTNVQTDPAYYLTHVVRSFPRATSMPAALPMAPDKVTMRVRLMPIGLDVLDDLIATKDLDPAVKAKMAPFTLAASELTWTADTATIKYGDQGIPVSCISAGLTTGANTANPAAEHTKCSP